MGRPRKNLNKKHYPMLEEWWEEGLSRGNMAKNLDMADSTLGAILKRDPKAKKHWDWGRGRRESLLWRNLHDPAIKNKTPIIYELKSRFGYTDMPRQEPQQHTIEILNFPIPKSRSREDFRRLVDIPSVKALPESSRNDQ